MNKIIPLILIVILFQSCSIFNFNPCKKFISDNDFFRANAVAESSNIQLSQEKTLLIAKKAILKEIDDYILEKYNYQTFLVDSDYEKKITIVRKTILNNVNIVCNKSKVHKEKYKFYIAIEISKTDIDKMITEIMKK